MRRSGKMDDKADGKFKEIKVSVKSGGFRVTHAPGTSRIESPPPLC